MFIYAAQWSDEAEREVHIFLGQARAGAKGSLQRVAIAQTTDRKRGVHNFAMI